MTAIKDNVPFVFPIPEEEKKEEENPEEESKDDKPAEEKPAEEESKDKPTEEESKDKPADEESKDKPAEAEEEEKDEPGAIPNFARMLLKSESTVEKTVNDVHQSQKERKWSYTYSREMGDFSDTKQ